MKKYCEVVVVGAGASGLLCGSLLAKQGIPVTILEKNNRVGKKLSATGNGRCNFTNIHMNSDCYYGNPAWIREVIGQVSPEEVIRLFMSYGIWYRQKDGYVYPHTNQASTVVELLSQACIENGVDFKENCLVKNIEGSDEQFLVHTTEGTIFCRYLIIATGGKAGKEAGGDDSGYRLVKKLGHSVTPIYPGLTGLVCKGRFWPQVAGTRVQGCFSLEIEGKKIPGETGEIQIVKNGVSGIPVFQLCRVAAEAMAQGKKVQGVIDFIPTMKSEETVEWIRCHGLEGLLPRKWLPVVEQTGDPVSFVRDFHFPVLDTFGIDRAQVTAGGVFVQEVNPTTMESRICESLFLLGEILDVDGKCGGYNLHLAWSTAMIAAGEIAGRIKESQ